MIGFDRPVKPGWIYETLKIVRVGEKPSTYNQPFEDIAKELIGKEAAERRRIPGLQTGREDLIIPGTLIVSAIMDAFGFSAVRVMG